MGVTESNGMGEENIITTNGSTISGVECKQAEDLTAKSGDTDVIDAKAVTDNCINLTMSRFQSDAFPDTAPISSGTHSKALTSCPDYIFLPEEYTGKNCPFVKSTPESFANSMLKLSIPEVGHVHKSFPLPSKVSDSISSYDLLVTAERFGALSLSKSQHGNLRLSSLLLSSKRQVYPSSGSYKQGQFAFRRPQAKVKPVSKALTADPPCAVSLKNKNKVHKVNIFLPAEYTDYCSVRYHNGYHIGEFNAYCSLS